MPLAPEEIATKQFLTSRGGYDREEVRAYLHVVAADQRALLERIESLSASESDLGEVGPKVASVLQQAQELADRMTREAHMKALDLREKAEDEARSLRAATADATEKLRQEAEDYAFEVRSAAERVAREQQLYAADRVGRLLAGGSSVRERLYALEVTLQGMRGELKEAAETVLPELSKVPAPLPPSPPTFEPSAEIEAEESPSVIDLRGEQVARTSNGSPRP